MTTTSVQVQFSPYALENRQDIALIEYFNAQAFCDVDDLYTGNVNSRPYATYEPDFWLLDGGYKFLPDTDPHAGYISNVMSLPAVGYTYYPGDDSDLPRVEVTFNAPHSVDGMTFRFSPYSGDYCNNVWVLFYDEDGGMILGLYDALLTPDSTVYTTDVVCDNVSKVVIYLSSTNRPYRYARLAGIDFGSVITWGSESIKEAHVLEDTDPLSIELRCNAFDLSLYSANAEFSILNPTGSYALLKQHQPLTVYEIVDNAPIIIGSYFLDTWQNASETMIEFQCTDLIGLMDQIPYRGGLWTGAGTPVQTLLADILTAAHIPYELDTALNDIAIIGWLPAGTLREALQQIAFAIGASVDCSRAWTVKIYETKIAAAETATATITNAEKGEDQEVKLLSAIAGVEVTAHHITEGTDDLELFSGTLDTGQHEILFSQPAHTLTITGAAIVESGVNYAVIEVSTAGAVTLNGKEFIDYKAVTKINNPAMTSNIKTPLRITDATLVHVGNVATVAQRVYDYYLQPYEHHIKLFAPDVVVGQVVTADAMFNRHIRELIETMDIDLAKGFVAEIKAIGVEAV